MAIKDAPPDIKTMSSDSAKVFKGKCADFTPDFSIQTFATAFYPLHLRPKGKPMINGSRYTVLTKGEFTVF